MDDTVTAVASTCPPRTLFYHFVICNYPTPPAAAGSQTRLSVTSNNSWRGGRVRMGAVTSHNARANSQTLILGIKLLSGWHRMTRQSETVRPLNFSPPNLQKNLWNDISTYQNKSERGRRVQREGQRVFCGITPAWRWLIKTKPALRSKRAAGCTAQTDAGIKSGGVRHLYFLHSLNPSWCWKTSGPACGVGGVVAAREWVEGWGGVSETRVRKGVRGSYQLR